MRKVSERQYGSMKKRFRILKNGCQAQDSRKMDNQFRVCCMLHNILLKSDRYDTIGDQEDDWLVYDPSVDTMRMERDAQAREVSAAESPSCVLEDSAPNTNEVEYEDDYWHLRDRLCYHFNVTHDRGEIRWMKSASQVRPRAKYVYLADSTAEDTDVDFDDDDALDGVG